MDVVTFGVGLPTLDEPPPAESTREDLLLDAVLSLRTMIAALVEREPTSPVIEVSPPDLVEIVTAVQGLRPAAGPEEIAEAIAARLNPGPPSQDELAKVLAGIRDTMDSIGYRLRGLGESFSANSTVTGHVTASLDLAAQESLASVANQTVHTSLLNDIKRAVSDFETRLDYDTRTDGLPVYVGKASQGTAESNTGWVIQRLSYDVLNRLTRAQVLTGRWDQRTTLGWS